MRAPLLLLPALLCVCSPPDDGEPDDTDSVDDTGIWGQESLDFVTERLAKTFTGEWEMFKLDESDESVVDLGWTDVIVGSNPRIEEDRAFVDVISDMDGGMWTYSYSLIEGVMITEDGGMGDYFMEIEGEVTIVTETSTDVWESSAALADTDLSSMANVSSSNLVDGWKSTTKVVSFDEEGAEHHEVSVITHVTYIDDSGEEQTVEFTSLEGYHHESTD